MSANTFGKLFRITTFGESHGPAMGVIIDGCPSQLPIDISFLTSELQRRKPGQSTLTTARKETEQVEILSGVFEGLSTGAPICMIVRNTDQRSSDYDALRQIFRPSHADYTWQQKYGIRDYRGSGRASARETVARVMGGAVAKMLLKQYGISIQGYVSQVGQVKLDIPYHELDFSKTELNDVRCPDDLTAKAMIEVIEKAGADGDTIGGTISCVIGGVAAGLGEPVFNKLHAALGASMLGINACKGFDYGTGFDGVHMKGSEQNDAFEIQNGKVKTRTNHSGGVQGGISNGEDIYFRALFKPVSSIRKKQDTVNQQLQHQEIKIDGRHDPCVLPRAVVIVEAMAALVIADQLLLHRAYSK